MEPERYSPLRDLRKTYEVLKMLLSRRRKAELETWRKEFYYQHLFDQALRLLQEGFKELKLHDFDIRYSDKFWAGSSKIRTLNAAIHNAPWSNLKIPGFWIAFLVFLLLLFYPYSWLTRLGAMVITFLYAWIVLRFFY